MTSARAPLLVATLNLRHNADEWERRAPLVVDELARLRPHLIALQEVWLPFRQDQWIADQLNRRLALARGEAYGSTHRPKWGFDEQREGVAILSRLPLAASSGVDLPGGRVAVSTDVQWADTIVRYVSVHLHYGPPDAADGARRNQLRGMFAWLEKLPTEGTTIIGGDFNATPDSAAAVLMYEDRWRSAYATAHQGEPEWTYGTALAERNHRAQGVDLFRGTLDYIFVPPRVTVRAASIFCDRPSDDDPGLFASDHLGVAAELTFDGVPDRARLAGDEPLLR